MIYNYQRERENLFTDGGQILFLKIRDRTKHLLKIAGAARCQEMTDVNDSGSGWVRLACVDRLVELGEIYEVTPTTTFGQLRVFISGDE